VSDDETRVRENVFDEDECRVLARFLGTSFKTVEAIGYMAWMKLNQSVRSIDGSTP
jgi:hypothetical protein